MSPWTEQPWNHKYVNTFGGACGVNYQQPTVGNVLSGQNVSLIGRGFAVGTSSLNTYGNQCNDIVSAEALMMTKEILTERHGQIRYTIGNGASAGTMQQHLIVEGYPGLLDGITTSLLYEDHWYQVVSSFDCILLWRYFGLPNGLLGLPNNPNPLFLTPAERQKVWGSNPAGPDNMCGTKINFTVVELIADSPFGCSGPVEPPLWRWNAVTNPTGTRCTIQDYQKALFGLGPDGKAPSPIDNVGVQYGLKALRAGTLTTAQFVDANARIGGLDIDGVWQPHRTAGNVGALETLYRSGRIVSGRGTASVAEIEVRSNITDTGFHPPFHSFTYRARLDRTNGNHDTHVIWVPNGGQSPDQILTVDEWLAGVEADTERRYAVCQARPAQAGRGGRCVLPRGRCRAGRDVHRPGDWSARLAVLREPETGGRLAVHSRPLQVPTEAARPVRLRPDRVHRRPVGPAQPGIPNGRLRLQQAAGRSAAVGSMAHLRRRPGRTTARGSTGVAGTASDGSRAEQVGGPIRPDPHDIACC